MRDFGKGKACGTYEEKRYIYIPFWFGNLKEEAHFEDLGADGRIILILTFKKYYQRFWQWLTWLRTDTRGCQFWTLWWNFWFYEVPGYPWLAEEISGSGEGQCCMKFRRTSLLNYWVCPPIRLPRNRDWIPCRNRNLSSHNLKTGYDVHTV